MRSYSFGSAFKNPSLAEFDKIATHRELLFAAWYATLFNDSPREICLSRFGIQVDN
jgi:hypothetical protein